MKAFYAFLFLVLIGMVFATDSLNRQEESTCPPPESGCEGLINLMLKLWDILLSLGCITDTVTEMCGGSQGSDVQEKLCSIGCCSVL
ncbi:hypothetical protein ALC60_11532 [Trachymyrmex zeteki]|uniref:Uncharacterized protein n=1 Tax=Mycetomoellerius zeteki TaxID=64791 RepID=A0A151WNI6_9HYME|nr:hypothetical protein ALC60_11532 [Trachymyrmex zeteki]